MDIPQILKGVVFSVVDELRGPVAKNWTNLSLSDQILEIIAKSTLDIHSRESPIPPKIKIVAFPIFEMKGVVQLFTWTNKTKPNQKTYASITLLYENKDDPVFYKYFSEFELPFQIMSDKLTHLYSNNKTQQVVQQNLEDFETNFKLFLNQLAENEERKLKSEQLIDERDASLPEREYIYKIIVIGDPEVGKTSTVLRFTDKTFFLNYLPTIGANITEKIVYIQNAIIKLLIWDIAGQTKFQRLRTQLYQGSDGIVLVYDLTNKESFINIEKWYEDLKKNIHISPKMKIILCGNKQDKKSEIVVSKEEGIALAQKINAEFFEISALANLNIQEIFNRFAESALSLEEKRVEKILE